MSAAALDFRQIIQPKAGYTLGNPSTQAREFDYGGNTYVLPGRNEDWSAKNPELYGAGPGTLRIYGKPGAKPFPITADEIVIYAVGHDGRTGKLGPAGVRVLFGDARDELVWEEGANVWREKQYQNDLSIQYAHQKAVAVAKEAGHPIPHPDTKVRDAMARVASFQAENGVNSPFTCQECGWPFNEAEKLATHMQTSHLGQGSAVAVPSSNGEVEALKAALKAQSEQMAALTNLVTQALTPRKPGRPKKEEN